MEDINVCCKRDTCYKYDCKELEKNANIFVNNIINDAIYHLSNTRLKYWETFYKNLTEQLEPSSFSIFVFRYITHTLNISAYNKLKLLDIGCGNGRDLLYFKQNDYQVCGLDESIIACNNIRNYNIKCYNQSILEPIKEKFDIYYCRFVIYILDYYDIEKCFQNLYDSMSDNSVLFIETRSTKGENKSILDMTEQELNLYYNEPDYIEYEFNSVLGTKHKRTLLNFKHLREIYLKNKFVALYAAESAGWSIYKKEDPVLIRLLLKKQDNYLKILNNMITPKLKLKQLLIKQLFDTTLEIINELKLNYVVYFGNLIGILRHNNLFIPWDDDLDICMYYKDIVILSNELNIRYTNIKVEKTTDHLYQVKCNNITFDIFVIDHNMLEMYKYIDFKNIKIINNYVIPCEYNDFFNIFYGDMSNIFEEVYLYNHVINDRGDNKNFTKIHIKTYDCKYLLNMLDTECINKYNIDINNESIRNNVICNCLHEHIFDFIYYYLYLNNTSNSIYNLDSIINNYVVSCNTIKYKVYLITNIIINNELYNYLILKNIHVINKNLLDGLTEIIKENDIYIFKYNIHSENVYKLTKDKYICEINNLITTGFVNEHVNEICQTVILIYDTTIIKYNMFDEIINIITKYDNREKIKIHLDKIRQDTCHYIDQLDNCWYDNSIEYYKSLLNTDNVFVLSGDYIELYVYDIYNICHTYKHIYNNLYNFPLIRLLFGTYYNTHYHLCEICNTNNLCVVCDWCFSCKNKLCNCKSIDYKI